jgi:hypothetical protein
MGTSIVVCAFASLVACGNGDDNSSPVPVPDAGIQTGTSSNGDAPVSICVDGGPESGGTALTPYSACSPYSLGCIPFDPARVPAHPRL